MSSSIISSGSSSVIEVNGQKIEVTKKDIFIDGNKVNKKDLTYQNSHYGKVFFLGLMLGGLLSKAILMLSL